MLHRDRVTQVEVGLLGRLGEMAGPVLFVVDHDTSSLRELLSDLTRRFGDDFTVKGDSSPEAALVALQEMASADEPVALMLVGGSPTEFLARAHELHPHAQRVLLIPWSNRSANAPALRENVLLSKQSGLLLWTRSGYPLCMESSGLGDPCSYSTNGMTALTWALYSA